MLDGDNIEIAEWFPDEAMWSIGESDVAAESLVRAGSIWRFLDDGTDLGVAWRQPDFDDRTWSSGFAQLGYGDGDESALLGFGSDPDNKFITTYFRHSFDVADPGAFDELTLQLLRDDGAVVYLKVSLDSLIRRLRQGRMVRPLLLDDVGQRLSTADLREKIKALMDRREPFYERAHVVVEIANQRVGITVDEVVKAVRRYGKRQKF